MNDERIFELQRRLERIEEERAIERVIALVRSAGRRR